MNKKNGQIQAVIFDWAGTTVDYGCFAPVIAFYETFSDCGIELSHEQIRADMGLAKKEHLKKVLSIPAVAQAWHDNTGSDPGLLDIETLYESFQSHLSKKLPHYSSPIPGAVESVRFLRERDIKIGSTTGYSSAMMEIVAPIASSAGYAPDCIVTPDDVPQGRPAPYMIYKNAMILRRYPLHTFVKVGDTLSDIEEGRQAGTWCVGIVHGSSLLGLSADQAQSASASAIQTVKDGYKKAGAHEIVMRIQDLPKALSNIEQKLIDGQKP